MTSEIFARLSRSSFRSRFRLGEGDAAYLHAKGREVIRSHARGFVARRLAPAAPKNDGKQTPMRGHPVFVAQHATATCCRSCLVKWHRIAKGRDLTEAEQTYVVDIVMDWIDRNSELPRSRVCEGRTESNT